MSEVVKSEDGSLLNQNSGGDWLSQLPEDIRGEASLKNIKDVASLAKGYVHAQKMVGADKIVVPGQDASAEDWAGVFKKLGLPESEDKYEVKAPDGAAEGFFKAMKAQAFKAGILPKQFESLMGGYGEFAAQSALAVKEAQAKKVQEGIQSLKKEWGNDFDTHLGKAQAAVDAFGDDDLRKYLDESGLGNDPKVIKLMSKIGASLAEDKIKGQGKRDFGMSGEQIQAEINQILASPAYFDRNHADHKRLVARSQELFAAQAGE